MTDADLIMVFEAIITTLSREQQHRTYFQLRSLANLFEGCGNLEGADFCLALAGPPIPGRNPAAEFLRPLPCPARSDRRAATKTRSQDCKG